MSRLLSLWPRSAMVRAAKKTPCSFAIRETKEADIWFTFDARSQLGGALLDQRNYAEADSPLGSGTDWRFSAYVYGAIRTKLYPDP